MKSKNTTFYDLNDINTEISNSEIFEKNTNYLKGKQYISKQTVIKREITKDIRKYFELNDIFHCIC